VFVILTMSLPGTFSTIQIPLPTKMKSPLAFGGIPLMVLTALVFVTVVGVQGCVESNSALIVISGFPTLSVSYESSTLLPSSSVRSSPGPATSVVPEDTAMTSSVGP
jgi:hypothetical protein